MEEKTSGIVLGGVNFGENDKILNIFTPETGVISAKIKGVKKAGAKLKFASEPFCFAEFIFSKTTAGRTVIGASLIDSFYPVREDLKKYFCAGTIVEFVKKFYRENIPSTQTFLFVVSALKDIAYADKSSLATLISFMVKVLKDAGYALNVTTCAGCGCSVGGRVFFDYNSGGFYCEKCFDGSGREVLTQTVMALKGAVLGERVDEQSLIKALKLIDYYLEKKTDENLSSLKELVKLN